MSRWDSSGGKLKRSKAGNRKRFIKEQCTVTIKRYVICAHPPPRRSPLLLFFPFPLRSVTRHDGGSYAVYSLVLQLPVTPDHGGAADMEKGRQAEVCAR